MECEVCGRDEEALEEIGQEPEFREYDGVQMCVKCIQENKASPGGQIEDENKESEDTSNEEEFDFENEDSGSWKDQIV